jgi:DNA-binding CsgD family transcriptional regulator
MVGREPELAAVGAFLERLPERAGMLLIEGEAGIGKTTMWRAGVRAAAARGYRVLACAPGEAESTISFGGLIDLLVDLEDGILDALPAPQRHALEVALLRAETHRRPVQQREVSVAATSAVRALAARAPVVLAVDDAHWLDQPSARVLEYVLRRVESMPVGLLASTRPVGRTPLGLDAARAADSLERLELGPLPGVVIQRLIHERLGLSLERSVLTRLIRACGGNPFYALGIARAIGLEASAGAVDDPLPIPPTLRELVADRLAALPPAAQQAVLATFAVPRASVELVEAALPLARRSGRGLAQAIAADALIVRGSRVELVHPLLGSVLYAGLGPRARRALHGRLATLLDDPEEQARHLAIATMKPDPEVAGSLERVAARARARGAPDAAAELGTMALRLTPPGDEGARIRRTFSLSIDQYTAGDSEQARARWRELVRDAPAGPVRAHALWHLAEFHEGRTIAENERFLEQALREAGGAPSLEAQIRTVHAEMALWGGNPLGAERQIEAAVAITRRRPELEPAVRAQALSIGAMTAFYRGRGIDEAMLEAAAALEPELGRWPVESRPVLIRGMLHGWAGDDLELGRREIDAARLLAQRLGDEVSLPLILMALSELDCWRGRLELATAESTRAAELLKHTGTPHLSGLALYSEAHILALTGEPEAARTIAQEGLGLDEPRGVLVQSGRSRALLGFIELAIGRPEQALAWLEPLYAAFREGGYEEPSLYRFLPDQVEALVVIGRAGDAEELLAPFERAAERLERRWAIGAAARCRGLILAGGGALAAAVQALERAAQEHTRIGQPFEQARTLLALGTAQRRMRWKAAADRTLGEALRLFERIGATNWARRAHEERSRVSLRPRAPTTLSATETRVAELAAAGYKNREIAGLAFLSVKTVEANLTQVYRKLGVRSRTELARRLPVPTMSPSPGRGFPRVPLSPDEA